MEKPVTHARRTEVGKKHALMRVVFEGYDTEAKTRYEVRVHWQNAFAYLRANAGKVDVIGATFADRVVHGERGTVSFAKWVRDTRTDLYAIEVGCFSGTPYLQEHNGQSCPCAYDTPSACAIHSAGDPQSPFVLAAQLGLAPFESDPRD